MTVPPFTLTISAEIPLTVDEVWPDGDQPANPSPADVADVLEREGLRKLLNDWGLASDLQFDVDGTPVRAR